MLPWQLAIDPQMASIQEVDTSRMPAKLDYEHRLISVSPRTSSAVTVHRYLVSLRSIFIDCYTCIKTGGEIDTLSSTLLDKLGVLLEFEIFAVGYIF